MTLTCILLILSSALIHAGWNLLSKKQNPTLAFMFGASFSGVVLCFPLIFFWGRDIAMIPASVWLLLLATGGAQAIYYSGLSGAYRHGDMSISYPLARSAPVAIVALATFLLTGKHGNAWCLLGLFLIVSGCLLLPIPSFRSFHLRNYRNLGCLFALLASLGTVGYSMIDNRALHILESVPELNQAPLPVSALYLFFINLFSSTTMLIVTCVTRQGRDNLKQAMQSQKRNCLKVGAGISSGYGLVLTAMPLATNISYVVAFRQVSIPLGAVFGWLILREPMHLPKSIGLLAMFVGLVLVALATHN